MKLALEKPISDLLHLFFPHYCAGCAQSLFRHEKMICSKCMINLPATNYAAWPENPIARMFYGRVPLQHASSFLFFNKGAVVQSMMHALKYNGLQDLGVMLGRWMGSTLKQAPELQDVDYIIPVPLHPNKIKTRGYNQCDSIAKGIHLILEKEVLLHHLIKSVHTTSQTRKMRFVRWQNTAGSFEVTDANALEGKHILLIDDVITTGATLDACAQKLLEVPGTRISIATLACA